MILRKKCATLCFGLVLITFHNTLIPAAERQEGESPAAHAVRIGEVEGKKRAQEIQNEELSLSFTDSFYLKTWGYKSFYEAAKSFKLTPGQKKTFFEQWMHYGIEKESIVEISDARRAAAANTIPLNSKLLEQAATKVRLLLNEGMTFLTHALPPKEVHAIGDDLQKLAHSVR